MFNDVLMVYEWDLSEEDSSIVFGVLLQRNKPRKTSWLSVAECLKMSSFEH